MDLPVHKYLDSKEIKYKKETFSEKTEKGAANVAKQLGLSEKQTVKTLIFRDNKSGEKVLIMVGGNQNAVSGNLKKAIGSRDISMASPEEVKEVTGYVIGSIPPFSWQTKDFRTFIEATLMQEKELGVGTGEWGKEIIISPEELAKATPNLQIVNLIDKSKEVFVQKVNDEAEELESKYSERDVDLPNPEDITTINHLQEKIGKEVTLAGWIYNKRSSGGITFLQIRDGKGFIQGVVEESEVEESTWKASDELTIESSVLVTGIVKEEKRAPQGIEIDVKKVKIIKLSPEYPISKKEHGSNFLFENRHLYVRSKTAWAVLRIRDEVFYSLQSFLRENDYTRIDTPIFQPTSCEDTTELFEVDYYGTPMYLTQSGQLYIEAVEHGLGKVYDFGPVFRAEKSKTRKHLSEFWMMDWETPFNNQEQEEAFLEKMLKRVISDVLENRKIELDILERETSILEKTVNEDFVRLKLGEAIDILNNNHGFNLDKNDDLNSEAEEKLGEIYGKPIFIKDYPFDVKAFYMQKYKDEEGIMRAVCADLIAPEGAGEIGTAAVRNNDYNELLGELKKRKYPIEDYQWYLDARKYGGVPHAGGGIGPERWIRWISGVHHIRETIPFPRTLVLNKP